MFHLFYKKFIDLCYRMQAKSYVVRFLCSHCKVNIFLNKYRLNKEECFTLQWIYGSSVKCVDTFRIDLTEKMKLFIKLKHSQNSQLPTFIIILRHRKPFHVNTLKSADNGLKNHDIISGKTSTDKGKNTCKKQVCN
ncbi:competence protein CoiA family protein [Prevotella fusca]